MQYFYVTFEGLRFWRIDDSFRFRANKILERFKMEKMNCETLIFTRMRDSFVVSMKNNIFLIRIKFRMNSHECTIENEQMKTFLEYENKYQT